MWMPWWQCVNHKYTEVLKTLCGTGQSIIFLTSYPHLLVVWAEKPHHQMGRGDWWRAIITNKPFGWLVWVYPGHSFSSTHMQPEHHLVCKQEMNEWNHSVWVFVVVHCQHKTIYIYIKKSSLSPFFSLLKKGVLSNHI